MFVRILSRILPGAFPIWYVLILHHLIFISLSSAVETIEVEFLNELEYPVKLFWLGSHGISEIKFDGPLAPGKTHKESTYPGDVFAAFDDHDQELRRWTMVPTKTLLRITDKKEL